VSAVFFIVSAWGSGIANSSLEFVVYRVLGGLAVGAASVMCPAYISEISPAHLRGRLASIQQVAIIAGLFFAFLSNYLIAKYAGSSRADWLFGFAAWRWMFWIELAPAFVFLVALFGIPESPRYLVLRDKKDRARKILERITGKNRADAKVAEIAASLSRERKARFSDVFGPQLFRPIVWVGIGLATFQQLVGINVIFYYGAVLWQAAGLTEEDALLVNVLSGALSIGAVIAALLIIDKVGRKPILIIGSIGMAVTLGLTAYAFSTGTLLHKGDVMAAGAALANGTVFDVETVLPADMLDLAPSIGLLALVSANLYVMFFNFSWGPVMWVMLGEMFPNQIRGSGLAVSGFFQWVANFGITMTFPVMLAAPAIGLTGAYGFYTLCAIISIFFVLKYVHETKGIELEEMTG
jgi:SP family sugar:H+ symporter-like MFS transporter